MFKKKKEQLALFSIFFVLKIMYNKEFLKWSLDNIKIVFKNRKTIMKNSFVTKQAKAIFLQIKGKKEWKIQETILKGDWKNK